MSESGETHSTPVSEDRPVAEGQESDVPSTATMHSKPSVPVTVPPEPCLEPRPPVDGAPDATEVKPQPAQKPKEQSPAQAPTSRPGVPGHIHGHGMGTIGTGGDKISPLPQQSQFRQPGIPGPRIQSFQPGGPKKSVEQMEEAKLRSKYGKLNKPGGSDFLRMRLNKGGQKYFDSGDYNMAKSKGQGKIGLRAAPIVTKPGLPRPVEVTTGDTIPTPASIHHRKSSTEISKLAV